MADVFEIVAKGSVPGLFALLNFGGFLWKFSHFWHLRRRGVLTEGRCTGQTTSDDIHLSTISFFHEGREYRFDETTAALSDRIGVGGVCRVRYDPHNPDRAVLASERPGLYALAWLVMTAVFAAATVVVVSG